LLTPVRGSRRLIQTRVLVLRTAATSRRPCGLTPNRLSSTRLGPRVAESMGSFSCRSAIDGPKAAAGAHRKPRSDHRRELGSDTRLDPRDLRRRDAARGNHFGVTRSCGSIRLLFPRGGRASRARGRRCSATRWAAVNVTSCEAAGSNSRSALPRRSFHVKHIACVGARAGPPCRTRTGRAVAPVGALADSPVCIDRGRVSTQQPGPAGTGILRDENRARLLLEAIARITQHAEAIARITQHALDQVQDVATQVVGRSHWPRRSQTLSSASPQPTHRRSTSAECRRRARRGSAEDPLRASASPGPVE
jgi:hypothetical protein